MSQRYNDVVMDLKVDESYTGRQIAIYIASNPDAFAYCESIKYFNFNDNRMYKIKDKIRGYLHCSERGMYKQPSHTTYLYLIEAVTHKHGKQHREHDEYWGYSPEY